MFRPLDYLDHHIDAIGIKPIADKVQAIVNFPKPSNTRQLQPLIDMIAFYKKFIPNCSEITRPIFALLSPHKYSKKAIEWTKDADDVFQEVFTNFAVLSLWLFQLNMLQHISILMLKCRCWSCITSKDRWRVTIVSIFQPSIQQGAA